MRQKYGFHEENVSQINDILRQLYLILNKIILGKHIPEPRSYH